MEKLERNGSKFLLCFVAGIITGILIGAAAVCIVVSYRMDISYEKILHLENTIEDKNARLQKLENSINNINFILKDIEIILIFEGDEIEKVDIEKTIKGKYSTLLGKEVKNIDADLIVEVVDKRILKIENKEYQLKVNKLILTEILKIWIEVEQIAQSQ
ncbi:MAG: hypothetical protein AB7G87_12425 [Clostridia bacterium]